MHIRKSHICANFVDMPKTKPPFRTPAPKPKSVHWMLVCVSQVFSPLGVWDTVIDVLEPIAQGDLVPKQKQKHKVKREKVTWGAEGLAHQKITGESPSGKATTDYPVHRLQERKLSEGKFNVIIGIFLSVQHSKPPAGCKFGDKCEKTTSETIAIQIPADDERQMQ